MLQRKPLEIFFHFLTLLIFKGGVSQNLFTLFTHIFFFANNLIIYT